MNLIVRQLLAFLGAALIVALPAAAMGEVIPISDVNEDDEDGFPVLRFEVVTVEGVVTVGTGVLADNTDIYVQDATGGVNVYQSLAASPVVAQGDSVRVTGMVDVLSGTGRRTSIRVETSLAPEARMEILSSGNPLPDPVVVAPRDLARESGEQYEGIYAVTKRVSLEFPLEWPSDECDEDEATLIAGADSTCRLWFDADTDICGSPPPFETFDVYGVVIPQPRAVIYWRGHGMLPPSRSYVLSRGDGGGVAEADPAWTYVDQTIDLAFHFRGEADTLETVTIAIPDGWDFSGDAADVALSGDAFRFASVTPGSTSPSLVTIEGCTLVHGRPGSVLLLDLGTPDSAGGGTFEVSTATDGGELTPIVASPEVGVGVIAPEGAVLINEIYAYGADSQDRSEFIELYNPNSAEIDLTGWVLTDVDDSGDCGGMNMWVFPAGASIGPLGYLSVAKDARRGGAGGFQPVFGFYPDWELYDPGFLDPDDPNSPNLEIVSPPSVGTSREIRLVGGPDGNGTQIVGVPSYEAVYLYSDLSLTSLVDAVEYRDPVFWPEDACGGTGLGGPDDAWVPGPPPKDYSLGRDENSTDTDVSSVDLILSSEPTPGAVNVPDDSLEPTVRRVRSAGTWFVTIEFTEPIDRDDALDLSNYAITEERLDVRQAWLSRDKRTVLLKTANQSPEQEYLIEISGIADLAGNVMVTDSDDFDGHFPVTTPISEVQEYDEVGFSPLIGEDHAVVGFATVPAGVFQPDRTSMYVEDLDGYGVNVYNSTFMTDGPLIGDLYQADGVVEEYVSFSTGAGAVTEIADANVTIFARGFEPLEPTVLETGDVGVEDREGALIQTEGVVITLSGFAFYIDDGTGSIQVYQNFTDLDFSVFAVGDRVRVTGALLQYDQNSPYFAGYELAPRYQSDMVKLEDDYSSSAKIATEAKVLDIGSGEEIEISYNATKASNVVVRIFDLQGREVKTLFDGMCLGPQRQLWDGKNDEGEKMPAGVYVCSIQVRERDTGGSSDAAVPIVIGRKLD
jgi:hypothetical protein